MFSQGQEYHKKDGRVFILYALKDKETVNLYGAIFHNGQVIARTTPIHLTEEAALDAAFALAKSL